MRSTPLHNQRSGHRPLGHRPISATGALLDFSTLVPGSVVLVQDETVHASGSHKEPSAQLVAARAVADGYHEVVVASCGNYGRAMARACRNHTLRCTVVVPADVHPVPDALHVDLAEVHVAAGSYEDAVARATALASRRGAADGNVVGSYEQEVLRGHELAMYALRDALPVSPTAVWLPIGNGTTVTGAHQAILNLGWRSAIFGVTSAGNNPVQQSWPGPYSPILPHEVRITAVNGPLANWHALHGPGAIDAIARTGGEVLGVDDGELLHARSLLCSHGPHPSPAGAAALAGLLQASRRRGFRHGVHIVLLSGAQSIRRSESQRP